MWKRALSRYMHGCCKTCAGEIYQKYVPLRLSYEQYELVRFQLERAKHAVTDDIHSWRKMLRKMRDC